MEGISSENMRGEVTRSLHTDGVETHKWVGSSLTSGSKAHLICFPQRADFVPTGRPGTQCPLLLDSSTRCILTDDRLPAARTGSGMELPGCTHDSGSCCAKEKWRLLPPTGQCLNLLDSSQTWAHRPTKAGILSMLRWGSASSPVAPGPSLPHWPWDAATSLSSVSGDY